MLSNLAGDWLLQLLLLLLLLSSCCALQLAAPVVRLLLQLGKLKSQQLLVLSCRQQETSAADSADAELRQLDWPTGTILSTCFPCDQQVERLLFSRQPGLRLLLLQHRDCLQQARHHVHSHWAAGETVVVPATPCADTLMWPLFDKVMYPFCIELTADRARYVTQRRHNGRLVQQRVYQQRSMQLFIKQPQIVLERGHLDNRTLVFLFENYNPFFDCLRQEGRLCVSMLDTPAKLLIDGLARQLHFRPVFLRGPDGSWGHEEGGVWKGMVGEVSRGEADFAIGGLFVTAKRRTVVDFAQEFALVYVNIVSRPVVEGAGGDLSQMLTPSVWLLIVASLLAVAAALWVAKLVLGVVAWRPASRAVDGLLSELEDTYRVLAAQDIGQRRLLVSSVSMTVALLLGVWFVSGIVNRTAYTSNLISVLTQPPTSWAPETFQDLVDHEYDVVTHHGYGTYTDWMNAQTAPLFVQLKRRWTRGDHVQTFRDIVTSRRKLALLEETPGAMSLLYDTIAETRGRVTPADMHLGREQFFPSNVAWAIQRNTPYATAMNRRIQQMRQFGLVDKWMADMAEAKAGRARAETLRACRRRRQSCAGLRAGASLSLPQVASAFQLMVCGQLAGVLSLVVERVTARCRHRGR